MGVEYRHYLIPVDPSFVPEKQAIIHMYRLMEKWALLSGVPKIHDLTKGIDTIIQENPDNLDIGQGLAIEYPEVQGEVVRNIMGESYYTDDEITDGDRYIQKLTFILGLDYRIHPSSEELSVTVVEPPEENGIPIEPYEAYDRLHVYEEGYHSSLSTTPPTVDVFIADTERIIGEQDFSGYWRTAFIIDCGKDLPKLGEDLYKIENRDFVRELEMAMGTRLIEIGEIG